MPQMIVEVRGTANAPSVRVYCVNLQASKCYCLPACVLGSDVQDPGQVFEPAKRAHGWRAHQYAMLASPTSSVTHIIRRIHGQ